MWYVTSVVCYNTLVSLAVQSEAVTKLVLGSSILVL